MPRPGFNRETFLERNSQKERMIFIHKTNSLCFSVRLRYCPSSCPVPSASPFRVSPDAWVEPNQRFASNSVDVEKRLELDDKLPLVVADILAVELLEGVDAGAGNETV